MYELRICELGIRVMRVVETYLSGNSWSYEWGIIAMAYSGKCIHKRLFVV